MTVWWQPPSMDEGRSFDWLVAMTAGRGISSGIPGAEKLLRAPGQHSGGRLHCPCCEGEARSNHSRPRFATAAAGDGQLCAYRAIDLSKRFAVAFLGRGGSGQRACSAARARSSASSAHRRGNEQRR